jgi:hypothetical protein
MWRWVKRWLWGDDGGAMATPVLVAHLFGPHALAIYRALREWQNLWAEFFAEHPEFVGHHHELIRTARNLRRLLIRLQRLRMRASQEEPPGTLHQLWTRAQPKKGDHLTKALDALFELTPTTQAADIPDRLRDLNERLRVVNQRTGAIDDRLRTHPEGLDH